MNNRSILQKADLELANLLTDGGALQPAQARSFIRTLIDESVVMPMSTVVPLRAPTQLLEKIKFGSRVLRAAVSGQALADSDRSKPDLDKEEFNAKLFKAEVRLNNEVLEDSIERQNLRQTVMATLAERIALDMDEVIINGDTTNVGDPFLASFDGILKQASVNTFSNGSNPISKTTFKEMLKTMPTEFLRNRRRMRFLTSVDTELEYNDTLASRETVGGDKYLERDVPLVYAGVPIVPVPLFPEGATAQSLLTDPKNIGVGIWRRVTMETDKDISAGVLIIVASLRFDARFSEKNATVKATDIDAS